MRLRLDYYDQNENFAALLPQNGFVERWVKSGDGSTWALFRLDNPIAYEGQGYEQLLLKSRWVGHEIGCKEGTSVFILLVQGGQPVINGFNAEDFYHVAWGSTPPNELGE